MNFVYFIDQRRGFNHIA